MAIVVVVVVVEDVVLYVAVVVSVGGCSKKLGFLNACSACDTRFSRFLLMSNSRVSPASFAGRVLMYVDVSFT